MSRSIRFVVLALATALGGCQGGAPSASGDSGHHGRYEGVGVYTPGDSWARIIADAAPAPATNRLADDEAVIVTEDSTTGEVRACGDLSGYCVGFYPWQGAPRRAPVDVSPRPEHRG